MRRRGMGTQILLAMTWMGVLLAAALSPAQTRPYSPGSLATGHSVTVIGPNSPIFEGVLEKDFPGVSQVDYY